MHLAQKLKIALYNLKKGFVCNTYDYRVVRETNRTNKEYPYCGTDTFDVPYTWEEKCRCLEQKLLHRPQYFIPTPYTHDESDFHVFFAYELQRRPHGDHEAKWRSIGYLKTDC